ncbi:MAG: aldo/keto reductase [Deltaproteobacteria bacterium RBG_16_44_11]|nr:MAG: aldo/keto reductase [Deltaproteobacteria bacterium RBG_16_44_11]
MKYVPLGKTGIKVSEVGFGGIPIIRLSNDEAVKVLLHAYARGITFYDTANMYRDSEAKIGRALSPVRNKIIIATKTTRRDAKGFLKHLEKSLNDLNTDYIDLYQFHQVANVEEWQKISSNEGALIEAEKAKKAGKIRFIGVTSHNIQIAIKLIKTRLFDTVQFPFNFIEQDAKNKLHKYSKDKGIGIIAMKPFAGGVIDNTALAFKYLRQFPDVIPIPGFDSVQSVDDIVSIYNSPNEVTDQDLEKMEEYRQELGRVFCRRCEYCQPCPEGVMITPAMGYPIVASRMSPQVSVEFLKIPMESTLKCTECGECIERCPYELPIPDLLKKNYDLFEAHRVHLKI